MTFIGLPSIEITDDIDKASVTAVPSVYAIKKYVEELEAKPVAEVGSIIHSLLPIDNVSHHLLDGTLLSGTGIYTNFYEHIAKISDSDKYSSLFIDEEAWQECVTEYGVCGKFVLNQVNKTVRLPKVTGFVEGTLDRATLGDLVEAGIPNTGFRISFSNFAGGSSVGNAISEDGVIASQAGALRFIGNTEQLRTAVAVNPDYTVAEDILEYDASRSSSIYGHSDTVQPQSIKGYIYMVVATGISDTVEIDFKGVEKALFDLEEKADNKANVALDNISKEALEAIAHAAMPSDKYISYSYTGSNMELIAPADGYFNFIHRGAAGGELINIVNRTTNLKTRAISVAENPNLDLIVWAACSKGDVISFTSTATGTYSEILFVYANGSAPSNDSGTDSGTDSGGSEGGVSEVPD